MNAKLVPMIVLTMVPVKILMAPSSATVMMVIQETPAKLVIILKSRNMIIYLLNYKDS